MMTSPKAVNSGQTEREAFDQWKQCWWFVDDPDEPNAESAAREGWEAAIAWMKARAAAPQGLTDALQAMVKKWERWQADGERRGCPPANGMGAAISDLRALLAEQSAAPVAELSIDARAFYARHEARMGRFGPTPRASEQADDPLRAAVESMVCMLENGEWAEHASTYKAPGHELAARLEAAITDLHNELSGDSEQADEAVTDETIVAALKAAGFHIEYIASKAEYRVQGWLPNARALFAARAKDSQ